VREREPLLEALQLCFSIWLLEQRLEQLSRGEQQPTNEPCQWVPLESPNMTRARHAFKDHCPCSVMRFPPPPRPTRAQGLCAHLQRTLRRSST
jgi:hypothetical protein